MLTRLAAHPIAAVATRAAFALGLFALIATAAGCAGAAAPASVTGRTFLSTAVNENGAPKPLVTGTRIRLSFDPTSIGASAGCNSIGGSYRIEDRRLVVEATGMTEMGCDPERHAQDDWLAAFLSSRPLLQVQGNELSLNNGATSIRLLDRKIAEPDLNIVGPTWTVDSIITGDAVSSVPGEAVATLVFNADGTVAVNAGCNIGSGTWASTGAGITFGPIGLTKRACDGPEGQLEAAVMAVLNAGAVSATIEANRLTLTAGAQGLGLTGA